jgi:anti-sigma regulatory factor (Ser/Thr protein kinase)
VTDALAHLEPELVADLELMVSELATNSVRHAMSGFEVRVVEEEEQVCVAVTDHGDGTPVPRHPTAADPTGRGLLIVERLAERWAIEVPPDGKTVRVCRSLAPLGP